MKNNKYFLPKAVYHQTLWFIRDYYGMCERLADILLESPAPPDGMPSGSSKVKEVEQKVERREDLKHKTTIVETALGNLPCEYRKGVWDNIINYKAYPNDADRTTYARYKSKFIYSVALEMKFITKGEL